MHGLIFSQLRKCVAAKLGPNAWGEVLQGAGLAARTYLPVRQYPDAEAEALLAAAAARTGLGLSDFLEAFGEFMVPGLLDLSHTLLRPEWKTFDILENAARTIHRIVRVPNPEAEPLALRCERRGRDEIVVCYGSPRKLCALARGIVRGLARHHGEVLSLEELACMHRGDPECRILVRRAG